LVRFLNVYKLVVAILILFLLQPDITQELQLNV